MQTFKVFPPIPHIRIGETLVRCRLGGVVRIRLAVEASVDCSEECSVGFFIAGGLNMSIRVSNTHTPIVA